MVSHLKDFFLEVLMLALLAMIIPTILEYICKSLKVRFSAQLYSELLNKLNIMYIVGEINKPKYEVLAFLIFNNSRIGAILKTIIFLDNIEDV